MKNLSNFKSVLVLILVSVFSLSCDDTEKDMDTSITALAKSKTNLSILVQALVKADLASTLQAPGKYTVFAPTDAAFVAFLKTTPYATLNDVPKEALKQILLNHVIVGIKKSTDLKTGYEKTLALGSASSTNNLSMYVNTA